MKYCEMYALQHPVLWYSWVGLALLICVYFQLRWFRFCRDRKWRLLSFRHLYSWKYYKESLQFYRQKTLIFPFLIFAICVFFVVFSENICRKEVADVKQKKLEKIYNNESVLK